MAESLVKNVYAALITTFIPTVFFVILRFVSRILKHTKLWWDDFFAVLAMVATIAYMVSAFYLLRYGLGRHLEDIPVSVEKARYMQALIQEVEEHIYTIAIGAAQLSLLALYWRIFQSVRAARITIWIMTGFVLAWVTARLLIAVLQCIPPNFFWNKSIDGECTVDPAKFFLWTVSAHLFMDVALIVLPATQISRLSLPWSQKIAIAAMFMFGIVTVVSSIMMLVTSSQYNSYAADIMWNCTPAVIWSAVEIHFSVIACCLPVMRPVVHAFSGWWGHSVFNSSRKHSHEPTRGSDKLASAIHRSTSNINRDCLESSFNFASMTESGHKPSVAESSARIYGQGDGLDTVIAGPGRASNEALEGSPAATSSTANNSAIMVHYEVNMSFSRHESMEKAGQASS